MALSGAKGKTESFNIAHRAFFVWPFDQALRACRAFTGDVLIVESEHDSTVPHQVVVNYREACATAHSLTYRVIEGADHGLSDTRWQQAYTTLLVNWLSEMVAGARGDWEAGADQRVPGASLRPQARN